MIRKQPWFERQFPTGLPVDLFPVVVERLRGTPARLEDRLNSLPVSVLTRRSGSTWSTQENAGHLLDLEPLWRARVEDLLARRPEMSPADLTNRRTHEANHNTAPLGMILSGFRQARAALVRRLEAVEDTALAHTAPHPRLRVPMSLVDHAFFVAEHDDYHLARITELLIEFGLG
ncbi:MAG: DinB family protein [Bacillati bacterium ANGP1]|uniref:DinB family protein n=1 Tax=Candidatus Segetimicrobium genomatis TaxID=2569760 RepID=A0A537LJX5_9BACT|nr:MAG: DinB family protein [Terrabacteria group bacterium ANGP1]